MELVFCAHFSPALFHELTDPVVQSVERAVNSVQAQIHQWKLERRRDRILADIMELSGQFSQPRLAQLPELPQYAEHPELLAPSTPEPALLTEFLKEGDRTILTGTTPVVYYNQGDPAWRDKPFGTDPIGAYACGPTAMAMVVATLTDTETDPIQMSVWAYEHGYWCAASGSYPSIVEGTAEAFGIQCRDTRDCDAAALRSHLSDGGLAVALVGPGHFTESGHFIVMHGVTPNGDVLVADPNSRENSLTPWGPQTILDEAKASDGNGVRIWLIG